MNIHCFGNSEKWRVGVQTVITIFGLKPSIFLSIELGFVNMSDMTLFILY